MGSSVNRSLTAPLARAGRGAEVLCDLANQGILAFALDLDGILPTALRSECVVTVEVFDVCAPSLTL